MTKNKRKNPSRYTLADFNSEQRRTKFKDLLLICTAVLVTAFLGILYASGSIDDLMRALDTQGFSEMRGASSECLQTGLKPSHCPVNSSKKDRYWRELDSMKVPFTLNE